MTAIINISICHSNIFIITTAIPIRVTAITVIFMIPIVLIITIAVFLVFVSFLLLLVRFRWTPHPVIVTIEDNRDHIRVL